MTDNPDKMQSEEMAPPDEEAVAPSDERAMDEAVAASIGVGLSESIGATGHSVTFQESEEAAERTDKIIKKSASGRAAVAANDGPSALSVVSKKYDLDGKGYLDDNERMMRQYDKNNSGNLDLREVYKIVEEVRRQQEELNEERKKILSLKRVIAGLVAFTLVLTLAMLGVSFAAAVLAKDTTVDPSSNSLQRKGTSEDVSTVSSSRAAGVTPGPGAAAAPPEQEGARKLAGGGPGRMNHLSAISASPVGRAMQLKRRWLEERRRRRARERELQPCFRASCWGNQDNADSDSDSDDNGASTTFNIGDYLDDFCRSGEEIDLRITREEYVRIKNAYFGGSAETSVVLRYKDNNVDVGGDDGDLEYQYTMNILEGYNFEDDSNYDFGNEGGNGDEMVLITENRLYCPNQDGLSGVNDCEAYQPIFVMGNCRYEDEEDDIEDDICDVMTCTYGISDTNLESWEDWEP